jgi:hypothetical protein
MKERVNLFPKGFKGLTQKAIVVRPFTAITYEWAKKLDNFSLARLSSLV